MKKSYRRDYEHYDSVKRKYKDQEAYLIKGDLEVFRKDIKEMSILSFFVVLIMYFILDGYIYSLANFDLTVAILNFIFMPIFYKKILTGEIEAYYRRSYEELRYFIYFAIYMIKSAYVRVILVFGAYSLNLLFSRTKADVVDYTIALSKMIINPKATIVGIIFFFAVVYILLFQEKYTTVRDYSNFITKEVRLGSTPGNAHERFMSVQDKFYDIKEFENVKADREEMKDLERFSREIDGIDRYNPNGEILDDVDFAFSEIEREKPEEVGEAEIVKEAVTSENLRRTSRR